VTVARPRIATPPRLIMAVFFMHAVVLWNWFPRIADVLAKLQVTRGELSIGLLGSPVGTLIALFFAGPIVERLTPRRTIVFGFAAYCFGFALPGWAWNVPSLFAALFVVGLAQPMVDVAMNVEADRIERGLGRRIMSTCHGFWSVGAIVGGLIGAGFAGIGLPPQWHLLIVVVAAFPIAATIANALPNLVPSPAGENLPRIALPSLGLLALCAFSFGMLIVESAAMDWSSPFMRNVLGISPFATGFGFGAFTVFMAGGRLLGDRLAERFGPVALARTCCVICLGGMVALVTAAGLVQAAVGLALTGLGISVAVPLAVSAAAGRGDRPAAVNVAGLSLMSFTGFLVEPPLIGFVSDSWGLRVGLATVMPLIVMSFLLAGELRRRVPAKAQISPQPLSEIAT
jgi:MFS family permease